MKRKELFIGALVSIKEGFGTIETISRKSCQVKVGLATVTAVRCKDISPIEITDERLVDWFGFKKADGIVFKNKRSQSPPYFAKDTIILVKSEMSYQGDMYHLGVGFRDFDGNPYLYECYWIENIHTLQHFYHANAGAFLKRGKLK